MRRILQVVMTLDTGGVEKWLLHLLRNIDRSRYRFDFAVLTDARGAYADELRSLGAGIFPLHAARRPLRLARGIRSILHENGPYHVVHGHVHHVSGVALREASRAGVPIRISHSHMDTRPIDETGGPARKAYRWGLRRAIRRYGSLHFAVSSYAAESLYGPGWKEAPDVRILPCGLDFQPFRLGADREAMRRELGIPADARVLGTVGRLEREKNHGWMLEILPPLLRTVPDAHFLLVGDGSLRASLEQRASDLGLAERVHFTGARHDVPRLLSAMDVFLFPSHFEGLGLAAIEAQAAGLPCLLSTRVPQEVVLDPARALRLPLDLGPEGWARAAEALLSLPHGDVEGTVSALEASPFSIRRNLAELEVAYASREGP